MLVTFLSTVLEDAAIGIATILFNKTGENIYDDKKGKQEIKKILKEDKKIIKSRFSYKSKEEQEKIIEFLLREIYSNEEFYCTEKEITAEQLDKIYERYLSHVYADKDTNYIEKIKDDKYNLKICVEYHNTKTQDILLSVKDKMELHALHEMNKSLSYIGKTLSSDRELLSKNESLHYLTKQLDNIISSIRYEIFCAKHIQFRYSLGIMICCISALFIIPNKVLGKFSLESLLCVILIYVIIFMILCYFWLKITENINLLEKQKTKYIDELWKTIYECYLKSMNEFYDVEIEESKE